MRVATYSDDDLEQHSLGVRRRADTERTAFEHDVDRILYSTQWRALAGKSQVVASGELGIYHTRLTHSMKVAQLGRRIAERMKRRYGGPDPALVEAASMAHDIGHPPFGHAGENALRDTMDELRTGQAVPDSFEGNAQTLRVLTYLAAHKYPGHRGLHLTRACLDAATKYPWERHGRDVDRDRFLKWGVYPADRAAFEWVRAGRTDDAVPVEEQIMDWADDVTYVCHDVEDFYRTGLIPLADIFPAPGQADAHSERETAVFLDYLAAKRTGFGLPFDRDATAAQLAEIGKTLVVPEPYRGRHDDAVAVNSRTADLISFLIADLRLEVADAPIRHGARLVIPEDRRQVCDLLKELLWCYVVDRPTMRTLRHGKQRIVAELLRWTFEAPELLPPDRTEELAEHGDRLRAAADHVASLTEGQAIALHRRLSGVALGSVSDNMLL
ncbi:dGTPase [Stackebrandtia endophytica]|uniref:dGTPase n=1 Tax=Stackebrandtia endophytica TaxID=1496996 RepID=A0A543AZ12_9ACTN|nr:dNTP triphosphohydrolase [Stackebrandtia endophytica]TQL77814.1 dGTPase [Stackebrandtia endophytica]